MLVPCPKKMTITEVDNLIKQLRHSSALSYHWVHVLDSIGSISQDDKYGMKRSSKSGTVQIPVETSNCGHPLSPARTKRTLS